MDKPKHRRYGKMPEVALIVTLGLSATAILAPSQTSASPRTAVLTQQREIKRKERVFGCPFLSVARRLPASLARMPDPEMVSSRSSLLTSLEPTRSMQAPEFVWACGVPAVVRPAAVQPAVFKEPGLLGEILSPTLVLTVSNPTARRRKGRR
jgi:hypothetical protein